jgi:hypothetical protein
VTIPGNIVIVYNITGVYVFEAIHALEKVPIMRAKDPPPAVLCNHTAQRVVSRRQYIRDALGLGTIVASNLGKHRFGEQLEQMVDAIPALECTRLVEVEKRL